MATVAQIQAVLDSQGTGKKIRIIKKFTKTTTDTFYCIAGIHVGVKHGLSRWCSTTNTDSAATQGAAIITAMQA
jgi:hypothetical protein